MIVSIWGNSGCGSSTLAMKLGLAISEMNKRVIVVDTNFVTPQAKIWFPKKEFKSENSMSVILANSIELDNVASKITEVNDYLGVLGYGNELSINAIPSRDDTPSELLAILNHLADIVIVDCQTNITQDVMSFMSLDLADVKLVNLAPDIKGISWYNANVMMLKEKWLSQNAKVITAFNRVKSFSPVDAVAKAIGTVDYYLMYADEIEEEIYNGKTGEKYYKGTAKNYGAVIQSIANALIEYQAYSASAGVIIQTTTQKEESESIESSPAVNINMNTPDFSNQTPNSIEDEFNPLKKER